MKLSALIPGRALVGLAAMLILGSPALSQYQTQTGDKPRDKEPQISEGERKALEKVRTAVDVNAKLEAAAEFLKKHQKSSLKTEVATHIAAKIAENQDATQRITLAEAFLGVFKEPKEADVINPMLIDAYVKAKRYEDAFRVAAGWIERNREDVAGLTQMSLVGTEQVKQGNNRFLEQSRQYGQRAIELIEADKKGTLNETQWADYKTKWLPHLYQSMGILSLVAGNSADAKAKLQKAASLNPSDPFSYALQGQIINTEYEGLAQRYKTMTAGPARDELLKQIHALIDQIMEFYAQAAALSEANPQYKPLHDQVYEMLQTFYKYRHNGSSEGLQQLIDKYKKSPTVP